MAFYIQKASGEKETFDIQKFRRSLQKTGADEKLINLIVKEIERKRPRSTRAIHAIASSMLQAYEPPLAARYNLKRALMELGPAGFSFEKFVAQLFAAQGYKTETNLIIHGFCVDHEVDIIIKKDNTHAMVECKFHNRLGLKTDVKVTLYIQARFEDIKRTWKQDLTHLPEFHQAWIATNTHFTSEAIKYASCADLQLVGWSYPANNSLAMIIDRLGLHPITALTSLTKKQKYAFIKEGFVLCRDARKHTDLLRRMDFSEHHIKKLIAESEAICKI